MSPSSILERILLASSLLVAAISSIVTQEIQFRTNNPFTVVIGSHLYTVSKYYSHLIVNSTDANYKSCDVSFNSKQGTVDPTIKAAATSSRKIVVASLQSYDDDPSSDDKIFVNYTILLVDPFACILIELASPTELVSEIAPFVPPEIVVRDDDTFDVFYYSQRRCSPCRYDNEGRRVKLQHYLKPEGIVPLDFHLHEFGRSHNYAYTFNCGTDSLDSALKVLDRDFNVLNWTYIDPVINDFAISDVATGTYFGAVLKVPDDSSAFNYSVFEFNIKLRPVFSNLIKLSFSDWAIGGNPKIDSEGTSYVTLWTSKMNPEGHKINLTKYNANGQLIGDSMEIGKVAFNQQYKVQTFLLEDKEYCLVIHEIDLAHNDLTKIKCINFTNK